MARAVSGVEMRDLKSLADEGKKRLGSGVVAIVGVAGDGKAGIVVGVTDDLTPTIDAVQPRPRRRREARRQGRRRPPRHGAGRRPRRRAGGGRARRRRSGARGGVTAVGAEPSGPWRRLRRRVYELLDPTIETFWDKVVHNGLIALVLLNVIAVVISRFPRSRIASAPRSGPSRSCRSPLSRPSMRFACGRRSSTCRSPGALPGRRGGRGPAPPLRSSTSLR